MLSILGLYCVLSDGFPKASIHLLIIPRNRTIRHTGNALRQMSFWYSCYQRAVALGFFLGNVKLMDKLIALETEIVNQ